MENYYTNEKNTQIVLSLLKSHGIKKVIASPGTTNIRLVASMQQDEFFEMYSAPDERSGAYIACGLAEQTGEAVVLTCTGATASRNYVPGLTEAFYRKLPILAITSTQHFGRVGQNIAQVIDRSNQMNDIVKLSVQIPGCHTEEDEWACNVRINQALLELKRNGGGPVHINLETNYSTDFSVKELEKARVINRVTYEDEFPKINHKKIGIFVGAHKKFTNEQKALIDEFCLKYNAVVLCDQTSNYRGKYRALFSLVTSQNNHSSSCNNFDLLIHIGNVSGAYPGFVSSEEWRINEDGEIRDTFGNLSYVFEMSEKHFFEKYINSKKDENFEKSFIEEWKEEYNLIFSNIPELPFSNIWIAKNSVSDLPENSILHLGILNTLRSWNFFETPDDVAVYANTGGFGIDGVLSASVGAALGCLDNPVFCIIGDLAFFYDMNVLGNRHLPKNMRIMLINNGRGTEFRNYSHQGSMFGNDADYYIAAGNHYGAKSKELVKNYAQNLGFEYYSASNKEEFIKHKSKFFTENSDKPILFEIFTNWEDESNALEQINNLIVDKNIKKQIKQAITGVVGDKGFKAIKKIVKRG